MYILNSAFSRQIQPSYLKIIEHIFQPNIVKSPHQQVFSRLRPCIQCRNLQNFGRCKGLTQTFGARHKSTKQTDNNSRVRKLLLATYGSIATGGCLLLAVIWREIEKGKQRMRGIERIKDPLLGSRPKLILYKDTILPNFLEKTVHDIEKFEVREDDVWIVSFPRSGTTWTQEIVYLIHSGLNLRMAEEKTVEERFPYLEFLYPGLKVLTEAPSPRLIKSHLPRHLLPKDLEVKKPKIIYIARNPKDVCVSYFHFVELLKPTFGFTGNFNDFFDRFIRNKVPYSPWWRHVTDFWEIKDSPNILYLKYEDMITDLEGSIRRIAAFLDKSLTDKEVKFIAHYCSFEQMKKNSSVNFEWWKPYGISDKNGPDFIRKGKIGQWKSYLTPEMNHKVDYMLALKVRDTGLSFYHGDTLDTSDNQGEQSGTNSSEGDTLTK